MKLFDDGSDDIVDELKLTFSVNSNDVIRVESSFDKNKGGKYLSLIAQILSGKLTKTIFESVFIYLKNNGRENEFEEIIAAAKTLQDFFARKGEAKTNDIIDNSPLICPTKVFSARSENE